MNFCQKCKSRIGPLLACTDCMKAVYCGKSCQKSDWSVHQRFCITAEDQMSFSRERSLLIDNGTRVFALLPPVDVSPTVRIGQCFVSVPLLVMNEIPQKWNFSPLPHFTKHGENWVTEVNQQNSLKHWLHTLVKVQLWKDTLPIEHESHIGQLLCCVLHPCCTVP